MILDLAAQIFRGEVGTSDTGTKPAAEIVQESWWQGQWEECGTVGRWEESNAAGWWENVGNWQHAPCRWGSSVSYYPQRPGRQACWHCKADGSQLASSSRWRSTAAEEHFPLPIGNSKEKTRLPVKQQLTVTANARDVNRCRECLGVFPGYKGGEDPATNMWFCTSCWMAYCTSQASLQENNP